MKIEVFLSDFERLYIYNITFWLKYYLRNSLKINTFKYPFRQLFGVFISIPITIREYEDRYPTNRISSYYT